MRYGFLRFVEDIPIALIERRLPSQRLKPIRKHDPVRRETEDNNMMADFAVGPCTGQINTCAPLWPERLASYELPVVNRGALVPG